MVDPDPVVLQHFVSDLFLPDEPARDEDILDPLNLDVDQLLASLVGEEVVQLETAGYGLFVNVVLG